MSQSRAFIDHIASHTASKFRVLFRQVFADSAGYNKHVWRVLLIPPPCKSHENSHSLLTQISPENGDFMNEDPPGISFPPKVDIPRI